MAQNDTWDMDDQEGVPLTCDIRSARMRANRHSTLERISWDITLSVCTVVRMLEQRFEYFHFVRLFGSVDAAGGRRCLYHKALMRHEIGDLRCGAEPIARVSGTRTFETCQFWESYCSLSRCRGAVASG
jgi:hypothetical protein